ncbi:MAG: hypothetical protein ACOC04_06140 [Halothece sp.]
MTKQKHCYLALLILLGISGCFPNNLFTQATTSQTQTNECPIEPKETLTSDAVTEIALTNEMLTQSGIVRSRQPLGYTFEGKAGDQFSYQTDDNICLWIFTPNNEPFSGTELPLTGRYTVQVSVPQGTKTFELKMSLGEYLPVPGVSSETFSSSSAQPTYSFNPRAFPKNACGDGKPSDPNAYPVNFYPVNLPYSDSNLSKAQSYFCRDAYQKRDKETREKLIQVASFLNEEKARAFADFVNTEMSGAIVGEPTTIYN